jgi:hypothetical protein
MSILKSVFKSRRAQVALFIVLIAAFATTDLQAQASDCKHCTYTCIQNPYNTCYESCIRMSARDCAYYHLECKGACYMVWDYSYGGSRCYLMPYYPCYV